MKAVVKPAYMQDRIELGKVLPLDSPFRMTLSVSQICNFRCFYCTHSLDKEEVAQTGFSFKLMTYDEFLVLANQMKEFAKRLKLVVFSGMGEPLLNKDLPEMIRYLKRNDIAERVEMYSNASLLTDEIVHKLVDAGLDSFKVSLQGLSSETYRKTSNVNIDFEKLVKRIKYFYDNRGKCKIYIKIIDVALYEGEDVIFYNAFGNICDEIFIEHLSDCQPLTNDCNGKVDKRYTMYNEPAKETKVCPMLFYSMYTDVDGDIYPCVTLGLPKHFAVGNMKKLTLKEIWNSEKIKQLRLTHLKGEKNSIPVCKECGNMICMYHPEDDLDNYSEEIIKRLK
ncbi:radical SAM protein [Desulfosporosinus sp. PR]|uniref:radical SAM/SPASM domain-containing protein n=1 Tax=Candidatus Desulfosporosinus nitrosoreducens TaxID=3401928 RepID=UPI0028004912|nr:radical SAM protein [Desulfosporosinus sp. PR]MDQ7096251.1 radical SAM protein [Desulfosporosinus sp. PR]